MNNSNLCEYFVMILLKLVIRGRVGRPEKPARGFFGFNPLGFSGLMVAGFFGFYGFFWQNAPQQWRSKWIGSWRSFETRPIQQKA